MFSLSQITSYRSEHLKAVNMSYFQHMAYALGYSIATLGTSAIFLIHAFIPDLFKTTGSDSISALHKHFQEERNIIESKTKPIPEDKQEDKQEDKPKAE